MVAKVFSLGMSFQAISWLIVDVSNALHVAQMIHVEDRDWRGLLVARLHCTISLHISSTFWQTWPPLLLPTQTLPNSSNILCYWDIHQGIAAYGYQEWWTSTSAWRQHGWWSNTSHNEDPWTIEEARIKMAAPPALQSCAEQLINIYCRLLVFIFPTVFVAKCFTYK